MALPRPCGTKAAHDRHLRHGENPCEPCLAAYREHHHGRYDKEKEVRLARLRAAQKANPERYRNQQLKVKFGITLEQFEERVELQNNACPICLQPFSKERKKRMPHMDHDHRTGTLRDVLCGGCNWLLGQAADDPETLDRAAQYLRRWGKK